MPISATSFIDLSRVSFGNTRRTRSVEVDAAVERETNISELREALRDVTQLRKDLQGFGKILGGDRSGSRLSRAVAESAPLGLDLSPTSAATASTEEVNTVATSYTPLGPSFSGNSTSQVTIGGVFTGPADDVYEFEVKNAGVVGGPVALSFEVRNGQGNRIGDVTIDPLTSPGTPVAAPDGLTLELSFGTLELNDSFQLSVSTTVGSAVDPDKPFNGVRNDNPNFEPGQGVRAGSFEANGQSISVFESDTINTVLSRINSSSAGLSASFSPGTERINIESTTPGVAGEVVLSSDTSGFLSATKLDAAQTTPGLENLDLDTPIAQVSSLAAIQDGNFTVNGKSITVDRDNDTLRDVIDRIDASGAGVDASFDLSKGTLIVRSSDASSSLVLEEGTSGFLGEVGLAADTYLASRRSDGVSISRRDSIQFARDVGRQFNETFRAFKRTPDSSRFESTVSAAVTDYFRDVLGKNRPSGASLDTGIGVSFDFEPSGDSVLDIDFNELDRALAERPGAVRQIFSSGDSRSEEGLIAVLDDALRRVESDILEEAQSLGSGAFINILA